MNGGSKGADAWRTQSAERQVVVDRRARSPRGGALRVLVVGDLGLEMPVDVPGSQSQFLRSLKGQSAQLDLGWSTRRMRVGGFVGRAAGFAYSLGAEVSICTIVPAEPPDPISRFLRGFAERQMFLTTVSGNCPIDTRFRCADGVLSVRRRGILDQTLPHLPDQACCDFDLLLIDPSQLAWKSPIMDWLAGVLNVRAGTPLAAVRVDNIGPVDSDVCDRWDDRVWPFMRLTDARAAYAAHIDPQSGTTGLNWIDELRSLGRFEQLVIQLGEGGAAVSRPSAPVERVLTCPVEPVDYCGAGDLLMTVAGLSLANGVDTMTCFRRAVQAATGLVAGLQPPGSLEELDDM